MFGEITLTLLVLLFQLTLFWQALTVPLNVRCARKSNHSENENTVIIQHDILHFYVSVFETGSEFLEITFHYVQGLT